MKPTASRNFDAANFNAARHAPGGWRERLIFGGIVAVIAFSAIFYGTVQPPTEALVGILLFACGALWCLEGLLLRPAAWLKPEHRLLLPLLALSLFVYLQTLDFTGPVSYDPYNTKLFLFKLLAFTVTLGALLRYTVNMRRLYALAGLVLVLGLLCALFGVARQALQTEEVGFILPLLRKNGGYAQFINKNHFATFMLMAGGLALGLLAGGGVSRERRLAWAALSLPFFFTVIVSGARSGTLAFVAELVFLVLLAPFAKPPASSRRAPRPRWQSWAGSLAGRILLIAMLLAGSVLSVVWVGGEDIVNRFGQISEGKETVSESSDQTNSHRPGIWRSTWKLVAQHPLAGVGFNGYWIAISTVHEGSGRIVPQQAHNDYLEILASGGIIGSVIILAWVVLLMMGIRRQLRAPNTMRRALCLGATTGLFGVAVQSLVEFGLHITFNSLICIVLIVLATADVEAS